MRIIRGFWSKISCLGVTEHHSYDEVKRIISCNQITILLFSIAFPYIFIFSHISILFSIPVVIIECLFLFVLGLNYLNKCRYSKLLLIFTANFGAFFYAYSLGVSSGINLLFIAFSGLSIVLYNPRNKFEINLGIAIPVLLQVIVQFFPTTIVHFDVSSYYLFIINKTAIFAVTAIVILYIKFFSSALSNYIEKLESSNETLCKETKEKTKALEELKTTKTVAEELAQQLAIEELSRQSAYATLTRGIAHEIKNPLQILSGRAYLVLEDLDNKEGVKKFAEVIMRNIERLTKLIHSMLDYGASSGRDKEDFCICKVVDDIVELSTHNAKQKGISISGHWTDSLQVCGNKVFIYQALLNLVVNAIQYTPRGGSITLTCTRKTIADKENNTREEVEISVSDTGVGISEENMKQIFVPYFTSKVQPENTGLGLSMAFKTVAENDGRLEVKSEVGVGTTFLVYLPLVG